MDRKSPIPKSLPFAPEKVREKKGEQAPAPLATLRAGLDAAADRPVLVGLSAKAGGVKRKRDSEDGEAQPAGALIASALAATAGKDRLQARDAWREQLAQLGQPGEAASRAALLQALQQAAQTPSISAPALAGLCDAICEAWGGAAMPQALAGELLEGVLAAAESARDDERGQAVCVAAASGLDFCGAGGAHQQAMLRKIVQRQHMMSDARCAACYASLLATAPQPPQRAMLRELLRTMAASCDTLYRRFSNTCLWVYEGLQCIGLQRAQRRLDAGTRQMLFELLLEIAPDCGKVERARMLRRACAALERQPAGEDAVAGASQDDRNAFWVALGARAGELKLSPDLVREMVQEWVYVMDGPRMGTEAMVALASAAATCAGRLDPAQAAALADGLTWRLRSELAGSDDLGEEDIAVIGQAFRVLASAGGLSPAQRGALARGMALASEGSAVLEGALRDAVAGSGMPPQHVAAMVLGDCAARAARGEPSEQRQAFWAAVDLPQECELAIELGGDPLLVLGSSGHSEAEQLELSLLACAIAAPWDAQVLSRRIGQVMNMAVPEPLRIEAMLRLAQEGRAHLGAPLFSVIRGLAIEQVRLIRMREAPDRKGAPALKPSLDRALRQLESVMALCPPDLPAAGLRREVAAIERAMALPADTRAKLLQPLKDALARVGDGKAG